MTTYWTASVPGFTAFTLAGTSLGLLNSSQFSGTYALVGTNSTLSIGDSVAWNAAGGTVMNGTYVGTVTDSGTTYPVITPNNGAYYVLGLVTSTNEVLNNTGIICFRHGTRIATPDGQSAIQALRPGDLVLTASGEARAIRWIGQRIVEVAKHPNASEVLPIRIAAGAIAPGQPCADLYVSPEHAILIDGVLVAARQLRNGGSIRQSEACGEVMYFHIELDTHDCLLAEGLACESYLDLDNRAQFDNGAFEAGAEKPEESRTRAESCAPFLTDAHALHAIWRRVAARSEALGMDCRDMDTTDAPELRVVLDGRAFDPVTVEGSRYRFALPAGASPARVVSRAATLLEACPWMRDERRLGVGLRSLTVTQGGASHVVTPDDAAFAGMAGWWRAEPGLRWTSGDGELPFDTSQESVLEIDVMPAVYPCAEKREAVVAGRAMADV